MGVKIILAKKKKTDAVGILAIQEIKNNIKTQKRIGIQVKEEYFIKYFLKKVNRFNANDELDYNSINNKITEELNLFNGLIDTSSHTNNLSDKNEVQNKLSVIISVLVPIPLYLLCYCNCCFF